MCFRRILTIHPPIPEDLSVDVKDFINQLLVKDPSKRLGGGLPDAEELKHHPFFAVSLLLSLSIRWLVSLIQDQWIRTERRNQKESGEQEMTNEIQSVMFLFIYSRTDLSFLISLKKAQETMDGPNYENWNAKGLILECLFCCVSFPLFFLSLSLSFSLSFSLSVTLPSLYFLYFFFILVLFVSLPDGLFLILQSLNWEEVAKKTVAAPFVPRIIDELDVSNFSEEFTGMAATDSPAVVPPNVDKIFKVHPSSQYLLIHLFIAPSRLTWMSTFTLPGFYRVMLIIGSHSHWFE